MLVIQIPKKSKLWIKYSYLFFIHKKISDLKEFNFNITFFMHSLKFFVYTVVLAQFLHYKNQNLRFV